MSNAPRRGRGAVWWAALGGAAVVGIAVAVLLTVGVLTWGSSTNSATAVATPTGTGTPVDTQPVTLPEQAASYITLTQAAADFTAATKPGGTLDNAASAERLTGEQVTLAYGGAAAAALTYAMDGLENPAIAYAVRAPSPLLVALPAQDPEILGVGAPINEVVTQGDVRCLVNNGVVPPGQAPDPAVVRVQQCQRTGPSLTVVMLPTGDPTTAQVARAVDAIWRGVSR